MKANTYVVKPFGISEVKVIALKGDPGMPTQAQVNAAVTEYFDDHPDRMIPTDGYYPDMHVGTADNLLSSSYQTDRTPYIIRRTPFGVREKGNIVGGSLVWNQLLQSLNSNDWRAESGVTATYADGVATVSSTTANNGIYHLSYLNVQLHKYLITFEANGASGLTIALSVSGAQGMVASGTGTGAWTRYSAVVNCTGGAGSRRTYLLARGSTYDNVMFRNVMLIDLTLMFGPTIADYIYAQEQASAGAGVALAKAWAGITADYYPYDAGSIKSVTGLTAHRMTDGNGEVIGEYPLDSTLTLRGLPKLDGDSIYYDGDIYPPSGEVERRYGVRAYQSGDESDANVLTDGTNTVYKLATPTTEQAEPYTTLQICDPAGTEEWVGASMPVGHDTKYYSDLKGKIEDIPDAPSADGTYTLRVTVSNGVATYSWG